MINGLIRWETLDDFFDVDEFSVNATLMLKKTGIADIALVGNFDTPYAQRDFGAFVIDADDPTFLTKWHDDFIHARKGDKLVISEGDNTETFYIDTAAQNDGTGVVSFVLTRESTQDDEGDTPSDDTTPDKTPMGGGLFAPNPEL